MSGALHSGNFNNLFIFDLLTITSTEKTFAIFSRSERFRFYRTPWRTVLSVLLCGGVTYFNYALEFIENIRMLRKKVKDKN